MQRSVLEYLEKTASRLPESPAFAEEGKVLSFSALRQAVRGVAAALLPQTGGGLRPVAVLSRRNVDTLVGCFGALWAGCFYAPLDAAMPRDRLTGILQELEPADYGILNHPFQLFWNW